MKKLTHSKMLVAASGLALALAGGAHADSVIFSDNFDTENGGVAKNQFTAFDNFTVSRGSVDLFGNGTNDFLPGNGLYVDMHGHQNTSAGKLTTSGSLDAGLYELSFDLAGAQRTSTDDSMTVTFGSVSEVFSLPWSQGFTTFTMMLDLVQTQTVSLIFDHKGSDGKGMLLDNIVITLLSDQIGNDGPNPNPPSVSTVPTPAAALAGLTLMGFLAARRRRQA